MGRYYKGTLRDEQEHMKARWTAKKNGRDLEEEISAAKEAERLEVQALLKKLSKPAWGDAQPTSPMPNTLPKCAFCRIEVANCNKRTGEIKACNDCKKKTVTLKKYGLSLKDYAQMLRDQYGCCAICNRELKKPCVDHCHEFSHVRGILCTQCNTGIGCFGDNDDTMRNAINYVNLNALTRKWYVQRASYPEIDT